jgi:predicted Zn-dependent peptidase
VRLADDKQARLEDRVSLERLYLVWPSPPFFGAGDAELDLLASVLGGKSGRLYKRLVYELQVAQSVEIAQSSHKLGSEFEIVATARPGRTAAEIQKIVDEELARLLGPQPVTAEELARAKNRWEASFVYSLEPIGSFNGRADRISEYFFDLGKADSFDRDRHRYLDATVEGVNRVAAEVLKGRRLALTVAPLAHKTPTPSTAASPPPAAGAAPAAAAVGKPSTTKPEAR